MQKYAAIYHDAAPECKNAILTTVSSRRSNINPFNTIGVSAAPSPPGSYLGGLSGPLRIILSPEMRFQNGRKVDWSQKMAHVFCTPLNRDYWGSQGAVPPHQHTKI